MFCTGARLGYAAKVVANVVFLSVFASASVTKAVPIAYDVTQGSSGGFQFSFLHDADSTAGYDPYYPAGTKLARISGTIVGDISPTSLTINQSTLTLTGLGPAPFFNDVWSLVLLGGNLALPSGSFTGNLLGAIDYEIRRPDTSVYDTGQFFFFDENFPGPPNDLTASSLHLWGNNWNHLVTDRSTFVNQGGIPLGIDLGGGASGGPIVPEPATAGLAALSVVAGIVWSLRRRAARQQLRG